MCKVFEYVRRITSWYALQYLTYFYSGQKSRDLSSWTKEFYSFFHTVFESIEERSHIQYILANIIFHNFNTEA